MLCVCFLAFVIGILLLPRAWVLLSHMRFREFKAWLWSGFLLSRLIVNGCIETMLRILVVGPWVSICFPTSARNSEEEESYTLLNGDGLTWMFIVSHISYSISFKPAQYYSLLPRTKDAYLLLSLPSSP